MGRLMMVVVVYTCSGSVNGGTSMPLLEACTTTAQAFCARTSQCGLATMTDCVGVVMRDCCPTGSCPEPSPMTKEEITVCAASFSTVQCSIIASEKHLCGIVTIL